MKELTERLTKMLPGTDIVVFTGGRHEDTTPAEMTTNDVRRVLRALNEYERKQPVIDALYLEKCEEVNQLKAQMAAVQKCVEQIEKLETHTEVIISDVHPFEASEVELISKQKALAAVKGVMA